MNRLLHLDASPRGERSHSRRLTREFIEAWKKANPIDTITYRDLGRKSIPHVTEAWIAAAFTPENERSPEQKTTLSLSDELIDEFIAADIYVMGVTDITFITVENDEYGGQKLADSLAAAHSRISELVAA